MNDLQQPNQSARGSMLTGPLPPTSMVKPEPVKGHSPVPAITKEAERHPIAPMDWHTAEERMLVGGKVTRQEWNNDHYAYIDMKTEHLMLFRDDKHHQFILSKPDMLAEDWIVILDN